MAALGPLDQRDHGWRSDLADLALAGRICVPHYVAPGQMRVTAHSAALLSDRDSASVALSELLHGEDFAVLDVHEGYAWGYGLHDGYVGHIAVAALGPAVGPATAMVGPGDALLFREAEIKSEVLACLPAGARLAVEPAERNFLVVTAGPFAGMYLHRRHRIDARHDWVEIACKYVGAPYRWGGRTRTGVDCSGLVQMARMLAGNRSRRDSDMQAADARPATGPTQRGDFASWPGHIGIMLDSDHLLHANAHWMACVVEPLRDVTARAGREPDMRRLR